MRLWVGNKFCGERSVGGGGKIKLYNEIKMARALC